MNMEKVTNVFIVLTYRNTSDIKDFLKSLGEHFDDYKVIIVNSYYDDISMKIIEDIANEYDCVFLNVPNKGYGYGNNRGIEYCEKHYDYEFLIISNPDIVIIKNTLDFQQYISKEIVIAPRITTLSGKKQNPYWVFDNFLAEYFIYLGYKRKKCLLLYTGIAINKILRSLFNCIFGISRKAEAKIFAAHGSFVIFSRKTIEKMGILYDENMFLFAEEAFLAHRLKNKKVRTILVKDIEVLHKEDSSMRIAQLDLDSEIRNSVIYYYEKIKM